MSSQTIRRSRASAYVASAFALAHVLTASDVSAQSAGGYATAGAGQYRNQIVWFSWGAHNAAIPDAGLTKTNTYTVAGRPLSVTCTLSNIAGTPASGRFRAYAPGNWRGDGLDDMYNQGQTGSANTMAIGLVNSADKGDASGDLSCSATYDGMPYTLEGLVFADAESTNSNENIGMTLPSGATFRFIEGFRRDCTKNYEVSATLAGVYSFRAPNGACDADGTNQSGPMGIGFIDGATQAKFHVTGGGKQAIALGVMTYIADTGDAPASYGSPSHIPKFSWEGGEVALGSTVNIFSPSFTMAKPVQPDIRFGALVDVETVDLRGASAKGDDNSGVSDEDALTSPVVTDLLVGGQTYVLSGIACTATPTAAPVYGFIDFNRNGVFDAATERSQLAMCGGVGSTVNLSWSVPNNVRGGASYLRLRIAANAAEIANADSLASSGEVEDHPITLTTARIKLVKVLTGRVDDNDQFSISVQEGGATLTSAATTGTGGGSSATAANISVPVTPGETVTLQEIASNIGSFTVYDRAISCARAPADIANALPTLVNTTGSDRETWTYTPVAGQDAICTITNTGRPHLRIAKTTLGGFGETVTITGSNLSAGLPGLTTTASGVAVSSTGRGVSVSDATQTVVLTEPAVPGYALTAASCTDGVAAATGNTASFGALSGSALTIPAANLKPGARILCSFTNSKYAKVSLAKVLSNGRFMADDQFTLQITDGDALDQSVTTTGSNSAVTGSLSLVDLTPGIVLSLTERAGAADTDLARYTSQWSCSNASAVAGAQTPSGSGTSFSLPLAAGDDLTCVITNQRKVKADLSITKTNTFADGPNDQADDVLLPGQTTTYTVRVQNNGPDAYTGAVVRDAAPAAPLTCPAPQPVTCSGPGCPAGPLTIGQLQSGAGLTLGALANGEALTLTYSCRVD